MPMASSQREHDLQHELTGLDPDLLAQPPDLEEQEIGLGHREPRTGNPRRAASASRSVSARDAAAASGVDRLSVKLPAA
jgi:hypothetical protein